MPAPECILWQKLHNKQSKGIKLRRQFAVAPYILDFYAPSHKLAIEIDGESHFKSINTQKKDKILSKHNITTLRFTNYQMMHNLAGVLTSIAQHLPG